MTWLDDILKQAGDKDATVDEIRFALTIGDDDAVLALARKLTGLGDEQVAPCKRWSPRNYSPGWVYLMQCHGYAYKVGCTLDPTSRRKAFAREKGRAVSILFSTQVDNKEWVEECLIRRFSDKRHANSREWLDLTPEDVQKFPEIVRKLSDKCKRPTVEVQ